MRGEGERDIEFAAPPDTGRRSPSYCAVGRLQSWLEGEGSMQY